MGRLTPPPLPTPTEKWKGGGHICEDNDRQKVEAAAIAGFFESVTVINDWQFAIWLLQYVKRVILRRVKSASDPGNPIKGDGHDYQRGVSFVFDPFYWDIYQHADPRIYLQYGNEENQANDGDFYRGLMDGLKAIGRRAVIFNDSVGATELTFDAQGNPVSPQRQRVLVAR